ncbi:hypothetical protein ZOSMA_111G00090 [Zostera marina]|uniref:Uncharacterized protein n=1 Tax=Zostera marina TaxID=29655 RepID=A0A0K9Q329_ZOSMR|nr:hypothetical protein ZOSMA_111G00090 [Zostera marina]
MDELRRGPWTLEEDNAIIKCIAIHGEGRWNHLAISSGLKRTGKSCRLRWLNYLKPDLKHGNLTVEEQMLIIELHSKWGNRWSKIAQYLPGRTDNEIKNYWRTKVKKHARQLKIDVNSTLFRDTIRCFWMPRLIENERVTSSAKQLIQSTNQDTVVDTIQIQPPYQPLPLPTNQLIAPDYNNLYQNAVNTENIPFFYDDSINSAENFNRVELYLNTDVPGDNSGGGSSVSDYSEMEDNLWKYMDELLQ